MSIVTWDLVRGHESRGMHGYAALRLAMWPLVLTVTGLGAPTLSLAFWPLASVALAIALGVAAYLWRHCALGTVEASALLALDVALICSLTAASGGHGSPAQLFLFLVPLNAAVLLPPASVALTTALVLSAGAITWAACAPLSSGRIADGWLLVLAVTLTWTGLVATAIAVEYRRRAARAAKQARAVRLLVQQLLGGEERERRRVGDILHDDVLQILLATGQDINDARDDGEEALARADIGLREATARLRATTRALGASNSAEGGFAASLQAIADDAAHRAGLAAHVSADEPPDPIDRALLLTIARHLVSNVERHAAAGRIDVLVRCRESGTSLVVHDDGVGIDDRAGGRGDDPEHGLGECAQRLRAVGGSLVVESSPGEGTVARVALPAPALTECAAAGRGRVAPRPSGALSS